MNTNNYLPFDLETALKHPERVVTRDGLKPTEIHYFKTVNHKHKLTCVLMGTKNGFTDNGICAATNNDLDLFLLPEVKECWVNVYETNAGFIDIGGICHMTKQNAIDGRNQDQKYIKTIRITNEPE